MSTRQFCEKSHPRKLKIFVSQLFRDGLTEIYLVDIFVGQYGRQF